MQQTAAFLRYVLDYISERHSNLWIWVHSLAYSNFYERVIFLRMCKTLRKIFWFLSKTINVRG